MILLIFDKTADGNQLISIARLIDAIFMLRPAAILYEWTVQPGLEGNGTNVHGFELSLDDQERALPIDINKLIGWLGAGECLVNAEFACPLLSIKIGIRDTTYLFAKSEAFQFLSLLSASFKNSTILRDDDVCFARSDS